jgi:hypothetical protein
MGVSPGVVEREEDKEEPLDIDNGPVGASCSPGL